jgi:hypothetical protein
MEEKEYKPVNINKKNYKLISLFSMIMFFVTGTLLFLLYEKNVEYSALKEKTDSLLVDLSATPEQNVDNQANIAAKDLNKSISDLTIPLIYYEKLLLLPELIKLKQVLRTGKNVSTSLIRTGNIKDLYLVKSIEDINNFSQNFSSSYYELKKNFNLIKKPLERDIATSKYISLGLSPKIAKYISKVFNYRNLAENHDMPETMESDLIKIEQYLEQEDIELTLGELKKFKNVKGVVQYEYELQEYLRINLLIDSLINYILDFKEIK